jgi:predicted nucleic acid-binding protein
MTHLLDTSAVLAHVRDEPGAGLVQELFEREGVSVFLCSVTLAELARRLRDLGATPEEAWETIDGYRQAVDGVVQVDEAVARESDRILISTPARLPLVDALIAAAASSRGAVLVHRDAHMRSIPASHVRQLDLESTPV